ncbi:MAG: WYL domain-containing protein [Ruminococcus sp.]|nr:WYL domain-containing protein [Ruminococcus sp.]
MYTKQPKKLAIMNILDILKRYTDENHRLSQREIQDILQREYDMKIDRKAVKRNLMNLIEFGYDINYSECRRKSRDKNGSEQENVILTGFYLEREFTDSELRLLIDSVLFSNHIPYQQDRELVEKLSALSNVYFRSRVKHITRMPEDKTDNKQLFYNVELLDEAIDAGRKVRFRYLEYRSDKRLHERCHRDGSVRDYIINPYQLVAKEGKYYLICNNDKYDNVSNYRVDRMADMEILPDPVKPFKALRGSDGKPLDLNAYMEKHIYMFSGENTRVVFRAQKNVLSDIIDVFGKDVRFSDETDTHITVTADVNEPAMEQFAKTYTPFVEIIKPAALREKMIYNLSVGLEKYQNEVN